MKIDFKKLKTADLDQLTAEIEKRKMELEQETLQTALEKMQAVATKHDVAFDEVIKFYSRVKKKPAKTKRVAKYRNPDDPSQTWAGKGRKPGWLMEKLAEGNSLESFAV